MADDDSPVYKAIMEPARSPVDDALDRLRQQINKSRYVPGTPEKYPATELRGLTVLEAEALLAQAEQLREERDDLRDEYMADAGLRTAAEAEVQQMREDKVKLHDWGSYWKREARRLTEGLRWVEEMTAGRAGVSGIADHVRALLSASPSDGGGAK